MDISLLFFSLEDAENKGILDKLEAFWGPQKLSRIQDPKLKEDTEGNGISLSGKSLKFLVIKSVIIFPLLMVILAKRHELIFRKCG